MKIIFGFVLLIIMACSRKNATDGRYIVCSTSIIANSVQQIVGADIPVVALMGSGVDPHSYKPRPRDVYYLNHAKLIVYNGCHLEGKMTDVFELLKKRKNVVAVSDAYPTDVFILLNGKKNRDPHIWFNPIAWSKGMRGVKLKICQLYPNFSNSIENRFIKFQKKCSESVLKGRITFSKIPYNQRVLITSHDAFHYYGKCFGIRVKALQGVSTTQEPGVRDIVELVQFIVNHKIRALFVEQSVSPKTIQTVIQSCRTKNHRVVIGGMLYSDALGNANEKGGNYFGMIDYNTQTIANQLSL